MGPKAVPAVLSAAAFARLSLNDHLLDLVQLLRAFADRMATIRLWATADLGAVSLSWNSGAYRLMADVITSGAWISYFGIFRRSRFLGHWWSGSVVRGRRVVSASGNANGVVHLRCCSRFHGAFFPGDHGIRWNFQPLDR